MTVVLDVSAAIEVVLGRPKQDFVASILKQADLVIAPSLYVYESVNTLWKYRTLADFPVHKLLDKAEYLIKLVDKYINMEDVYGDMLSLACEIDHPAYDAAYLLLGRKYKASLLTLDSRLIKAAEKAGVTALLEATTLSE
jgi:predicted nucleic acid-binding protein